MMKFASALCVAALAGSAKLTTAFAPGNLITSTSKTQLYTNLWGEPTEKEDERLRAKSQALPFAPRPKILDSIALAGDAGFDPFGFAGPDKASLLYMREAEIKHGRLAMLAIVAWPLQELLDKPIANFLNLPIKLTKSGASPSLVNGGLEKIDAAYWIAVVALAGIVELEIAKAKEEKGANYMPGDVNFDPLRLYPSDEKGQMRMQTAELKHGRLTMMALLGFVVQEALYGEPVVAQTPQFFTPHL